MKTTHLKTSRTARYFVLNDNDLPIKEVLFVLHGYGMSAARFLEDFQTIAKPGLLIVAPEGLSRFYKKGFSGDVVASWMTRDDRKEEIEDYLEYLNRVYESVIPNPESVKTVVLGFSQGASTASRWVMSSRFQHSALVLYSGEFATDITQLPVIKPVVWNVVGNNDEFITADRFKKQTIDLKNAGFEVREILFEGGHKIHQQDLDNLIQKTFEITGS